MSRGQASVSGYLILETAFRWELEDLPAPQRALAECSVVGEELGEGGPPGAEAAWLLLSWAGGLTGPCGFQAG